MEKTPSHNFERSVKASLIDSRTQLFGVIGNPVGHSLSPTMHNAALQAMAYPGVYLAFQVADVHGALAGVRALNISGLSVTIPHKVAVMEGLDEIDDLARHIGAVNTVVNRSGYLMGFNTDCFGAVAALKEKTGLQGRQVALLGAGGAARAIGFGLLAEGARVTVYNRSVTRGRQLAQALQVGFMPLERFGSGAAEIVINTTAVGMLPNRDVMPVPPETLQAGMLVMDIVYNPLDTKLLKAARSQGCTAIDGVSMFVLQGARQLKLWTGQPAPVEIMRQAVLKALAATQSSRV